MSDILQVLQAYNKFGNRCMLIRTQVYFNSYVTQDTKRICNIQNHNADIFPGIHVLVYKLK